MAYKGLKNYLTNPKWIDALGVALEHRQFNILNRFVQTELASGRTVSPSLPNIFRALNLCPPDAKVVILGQDPYPTPGRADGLAFSTQDAGPLPPSLRNILTELSEDLKIPAENRIFEGNLTEWAKQKVMLLNTIMTVGDKTMSHEDIGWQAFTQIVIEILNKEPSKKVFILWGKKAESYAKLLDARHLVMIGSHPSPLSVNKYFYGRRFFSTANLFLSSVDRRPIKWEAICKHPQ